MIVIKCFYVCTVMIVKCKSKEVPDLQTGHHHHDYNRLDAIVRLNTCRRSNTLVVN